MTTPDPATFGDLCGGLPGHHSELMTGHEGRPTVATQDERNGAGLPAVDRGLDDKTKYGGGRL
jgi:hypothetical protein